MGNEYKLMTDICGGFLAFYIALNVIWPHLYIKSISQFDTGPGSSIDRESGEHSDGH